MIMDLSALIESYKDCPCGKAHTSVIKAVEIDNGVVFEAGKILAENDFPKNILLVSDEPAFAAADGIMESLEKSGFNVKKYIYPIMKKPLVSQVHFIRDLSVGCDGILSVGTGSVNDICRYAAFLENKAFSIFGTAPSMDGFASSVAPIVSDEGFKVTFSTNQPSVIMADTKILAAAPAELKAAGFGDVIGKKIARVDWEVSRLITGEYFCENVASLVEGVVDTLVSLADRLLLNDEAAAKVAMEALVLSGLSMSLVGVSRPASGAEHMIAHFWEIKQLELLGDHDYHGKLVGIATVKIAEEYRKLAKIKEVFPGEEFIDWAPVEEAYGPNLYPDVKKLNEIPITKDIDPEILRERWRQITEIINKFVPETEELIRLMSVAGATVDPKDADLNDKLVSDAMNYHAYMRNRITLSRMRPMLKI